MISQKQLEELRFQFDHGPKPINPEDLRAAFNLAADALSSCFAVVEAAKVVAEITDDIKRNETPTFHVELEQKIEELRESLRPFSQSGEEGE